MPIREFTDVNGIEWRVWDVTAEQLKPVTRVEDLIDLAQGWLTFESATEKRRLPAPYPANWHEIALTELEELCRRAVRVVPRPVRDSAPPARDSGAIRALEETAVAVARRHTSHESQFSSPRGRQWAVRLHEFLEPGGKQQTVLRFSADDIVVDLDDWPRDWRDRSPEEYAMMMLDARPPRRLGDEGDGGRQRGRAGAAKAG